MVSGALKHGIGWYRSILPVLSMRGFGDIITLNVCHIVGHARKSSASDYLEGIFRTILLSCCFEGAE